MRLDITLESHEINEHIWEKIKMFIGTEQGHFKISIEKEDDETAFLLKNAKNRKRLLEAVSDVKKGKNLTVFKSIDDLKKNIK
ncbi:MAG: hypothetical protein ACPG49_01925 [Chitinophagales bacterium]